MKYRIDEQPLKDRKQTSDEIKRLVREYASDLENIFIPVANRLVRLSTLSFPDYFDFVRNIPYKRDTAPIELIGRPMWIMEKRAGGADCKKKAVMIAAWLHLHNIPYRFIGSSRRTDKVIHHIFPQARTGTGWTNVDATYSNYTIGQSKTVTESEVL
jgi:hypothetical protein